jgi:hypothetical protein
MRKRNETRKFRKLRKGSKKYSTHRNKSGGGLSRYFTSDGRLLEEFKTKVRLIDVLGPLLDNQEYDDNDKEIATQPIVLALKRNPLSLFELNEFINTGDNYKRLERILDSDMSITRKKFYKKVLQEVPRIYSPSAGARAGAGDEGTPPVSFPPPPARALPPTPSRPPGPGMGDEIEGEIITNSDGKKVYVNSSLPCGVNDQGKHYLNDEEEPSYFTSDIGKDENITNLRCKFCFKSKREHTQQGQGQGQGGGSRRRRRNTRSRKNKTRRNGKCRACKCPGGCKRSTCPCYRGRSKPCCTKRCRSRGRVCRC